MRNLFFFALFATLLLASSIEYDQQQLLQNFSKVVRAGLEDGIDLTGEVRRDE
jgi:hypothetical protein